jgi:hypothetical protein
MAFKLNNPPFKQMRAPKREYPITDVLPLYLKTSKSEANKENLITQSQLPSIVATRKEYLEPNRILQQDTKKKL